MAPTRSAAQRTVTRAPVAMASGEPASTAWSIGAPAPSSWTSAQANGRSSGLPSFGRGCQDQVTTVPVADTSAHSVHGSPVTGSNSSGGTCTVPLRSFVPSSRPSRSEVKKRESVVPTVRLYGYESTSGAVNEPSAAME